MTDQTIPCFVGFHPAEAEEAAQHLGLTLIWSTAEAPHWLSAQHEPRIARQRLREDGAVELLCVLVPTLRSTSPPPE